MILHDSEAKLPHSSRACSHCQVASGEEGPFSDPCDDTHLNPTFFSGSQTRFFEDGAAAFDKTGRRRADRRDHKSETVQANLDPAFRGAGGSYAAKGRNSRYRVT